MQRSHRTLQIEARLKTGQSLSAVARDLGVTRQRVQAVKKRLLADYSAVTATVALQHPPTCCTNTNAVDSNSMKHFTVNLTTAVHDALVEACAKANRQSEEDPITIGEYTEELIINHVVEMGLLRKKGIRQ